MRASYVPGAVFQVLPHFVLTQSCEVGIIIIPVLQMSELKHREVR